MRQCGLAAERLASRFARIKARAAEAWPISEADAGGLREIFRHLTDPSPLVREGAKQPVVRPG